jgi:hypothetical protein
VTAARHRLDGRMGRLLPDEGGLYLYVQWDDGELVGYDKYNCWRAVELLAPDGNGVTRTRDASDSRSIALFFRRSRPRTGSGRRFARVRRRPCNPYTKTRSSNKRGKRRGYSHLRTYASQVDINDVPGPCRCKSAPLRELRLQPVTPLRRTSASVTSARRMIVAPTYRLRRRDPQTPAARFGDCSGGT